MENFDFSQVSFAQPVVEDDFEDAFYEAFGGGVSERCALRGFAVFGSGAGGKRCFLLRAGFYFWWIFLGWDLRWDFWADFWGEVGERGRISEGIDFWKLWKLTLR